MKSEVARPFVYHSSYNYLTKAKHGKQYIDIADDLIKHNDIPKVQSCGIWFVRVRYNLLTKTMQAKLKMEGK